MRTIKVCKIGENFGLGQAVGNGRHDTCWVVECDQATPGCIEYNGKFYRKFNTFDSAEKFCHEE